MPSDSQVRLIVIGQQTMQVVLRPDGKCQIEGRERVFRTFRDLQRAVKGRSGRRNGRGGNRRSIRHHHSHGRAR